MAAVIKILLADDDSDDRDFFSEALASVDPDVVYQGVEDGQQAIHALASDTIRPNVIFLDINMPILNGWELLKKLKSDDRYADIPVIIYSTSSGQRERKIALDLGALCFVTKPESVKLIEEMLDRVIAKIKDNDMSPQLCHEIQTLIHRIY